MSDEYNDEHVIDEEPTARIKQSRWVSKSNIDRYDKKQQQEIDSTYGEEFGWSKAARVTRRGR